MGECKSLNRKSFTFLTLAISVTVTLNSSASCFWFFVSLLALVFCQAFWPAAQFLSMLVAKTPDLHRLNRKSHPARRRLLFVEFLFLSLHLLCFTLGTSRADFIFVRL